MRKTVWVLAAAVLLLFPRPNRAQQVSNPSDAGYRIRVTSDLVLVNVIVRDKQGNLVRGLKKEDFTLSEDGQPQRIQSFDIENVEELALAAQSQAAVSGAAAPEALLRAAPGQPAAFDARNRRLLLLFFDFTGMDPEQVDRSVRAAKQFVETSLHPADLVALVSLATSLRVDLDFTGDKTRILRVLAAYASGQGQGFEYGATGSAEGSAETGGSFAADDTDFNQFNTDRKLLALQSLMSALTGIPQKKSIIYFSNGISRSDIDNQSALRAATAAAVKANVSIYPLDIRGLEALPPGGEAQSASLHGVSAYSGRSVIDQFDSNAATQETLSTLAADTGGKAFFDSNDFSAVFSQAQKDSSAYYVLGFTSGNKARDGRFRRLRVNVSRPGVKLDYRFGYYADRDFEHLNRASREEQLETELASDLPQTGVVVYAGASYFRRDGAHYYLAVSLVIPGSQIPFVSEKDKDSATIDVIGEVREPGKTPVGHLRDTVKLAVGQERQVRSKNVQYNTGFLLPPGSFHLKFIVRENRTGRMGSFETDVQIPDLRKTLLKMSSVVLGSQRVPFAGKKGAPNPLVQDQYELLPNVTHVFRQDQHLYLQYEVYEPARARNAEAAAHASSPPAKANRGELRVLTSIEFLQGATKAYESKPVVASELSAPDRKAVIFQIDLPLQSFKPGLYTCQVNVIDDAAGNFSFPRSLLLIRESVAGGPRQEAKPPSP
ncbi:MAG: VWA domain-containing protein [Acidobacteriia bacterium]|nr:VWA domain-containing protein [Terriglobia bacterium]